MLLHVYIIVYINLLQHYSAIVVLVFMIVVSLSFFLSALYLVHCIIIMWLN